MLRFILLYTKPSCHSSLVTTFSGFLAVNLQLWRRRFQLGDPTADGTMKNKLFALLALTLLCAFNFQLSTASAQGTTFTYQGRLDVDGTPANGVYDFNFRAFNAPTNGSFFGGAVLVPAVWVSNGLFTVSLAFNSAAFDGSARWLDIGVTTNGGATFSSLTPRQPVTATPYAMIAGNVTGAIPLAQLPSSVVTNGASGINITGTFSGNGAGVTNVDLSLNSSGSIRLGTGDFILNSSPGVGNTPYSVTAADVNGDGKVDLISANYAANTLTVLTNNGSGGFVLASSPAVGSHPNSVTAADVNGDGKPDLISANFSASTLTVLTNNGSGGFVLASSPGVGAGPISVTAADVNGDGKVDLISANGFTNTLSVLTNNGSGGFVLASSPSLGSSPQSVTAADVNGDGKLDLISANGVANNLTVWFNATGFNGVFVGTGQFSSASFGTASFGASLGPKLNLYNTTFGLGIQNSVLYSRVAVGGGFGWFAGGVHNDNTFNAGGGSVLMTLTSGGLAVNGTFVSASDRNIKQDFSEVDSRAVLEKVAQLPIQTWVYKNDPGTKHLGPMAQDFYAAFAVGPDDKHITTVDESGVALAAIQGLNQKLEKQRAENAELKLRLEMLERLMSGGVK